jgi:hypothetical protein
MHNLAAGMMLSCHDDLPFLLGEYRKMPTVCQEETDLLSEASNMSGIVARNLSGLIWSQLEVADETDGDVTGDPEDAI